MQYVLGSEAGPSLQPVDQLITVDTTTTGLVCAARHELRYRNLSRLPEKLLVLVSRSPADTALVDKAMRSS